MLNKSDLKEIKNIFTTGLRIEFSPIKKDLIILKRDVSLLKQDVTLLKLNVSKLNNGFALLSHAVVSLENTQKYYSDLFYLNRDNISKLAQRTNTLEAKTGIKSSPELAISGV